MSDVPEVVNDRDASRFEIRTDQGLAELVYKQRGADLDLIHTEVPPPLEDAAMPPLSPLPLSPSRDAKG